MTSKIFRVISLATLFMFSMGQASAASQSELFSLQAEKSPNLPENDMFSLFGWMEDGCMANSPLSYRIRKNHNNLITMTMSIKTLAEPNEYDKMYEFYITPKSEWPPSFVPLAKDVSLDINQEYNEYHIKFADGVKYREQPIKEYHYEFRPQLGWGSHVLKFAKNANMESVLKHLKTRSVFNVETGVSYEKTAEFDRNNNTLTCYY